MRILIVLLFLGFTTTVHAGDFVCHDGTGYNLYKSISCGQACSSDPNCIRAGRDTNIVDKKIVGDEITNKLQSELDAEIQAELDAERTKECTSIGDLDITLKDAFVAFLQVYNSKVPAQYQVPPDEVKAQVVVNKGVSCP